MMGTQNAAVENRSGLSGLFGAQGALASGEFDPDGEFTEALEEQLGGLLAELGVDAKTLQAMDIDAMLAKLQALLEGQADAAGGDGLPLDLEALEFLKDDGASSGAAMSLAALKLFLQANGAQDGDAEDDARTALAALLQQWMGQSSTAAVGAGASDLPAQLRSLLAQGVTGDGEGAGTSDLLAQLRSFLAQGAGGDTEGMDSRRQMFDQFLRALSDGSGDTHGSDALALLRASLASNARGNEQGNATEGAKAFDLARLLTPDGAKQLADRLALIAQARGGVAELKLNPPSLGSMEVRVTMEADKAHVHFVSPNPAVRDLLESALPRLRDALAQDGISLGDASVSDQPPQSRDEASAQGAEGDGDGDPETEHERPLDGSLPQASSTLSALARKLDLFA